MPRGNFDLWRSCTAPLLVLLRERLLKPGPDVGRNVPVRLNHFVSEFMGQFFFRKYCDDHLSCVNMRKKNTN